MMYQQLLSNIILPIGDFINNSTIYQNEDELLNTNSSGSKDQLLNKLELHYND